MKKASIITFMLLILCGCGKESTPLTVTPDSLILYYQKSSQLTASDEQATFRSEDEFYATVDDAGMVTAGKVGKTDIIVSSGKGTVRVPVEVIPAYDLYPDIDTFIGATQSQISAKFGSSYSESTASGGGTMWSYTQFNKYSNIAFLFEGGKVSQALVAVPTTYTSMLSSYLKERYTVAGMLNDYFFLLNHDKDVVITLTVYSSKLLAVLYVPYSETKGNGSKADRAAFEGVFED